MDYITACYYSRMRPYKDRPDISVPGRWHWCPDGAKSIPYFHLFGSFTMDEGEQRKDPPIGEIPQKNGRSRGESDPGYMGQHFCGDKEAWTQGILLADATPVEINEDGIPVCCGVDPDLPGGVEVDGEAEIRVGAGGGLALGGVGSDPPDTEEHADGGLEVGGVGVPILRTIYHADGGLEVGGQSPPVPYDPTDPTPSDLEFGGDGSRPLTTEIVMDGGGEFGGDGSKPLTTEIVMEGGGEFGGDGSKPFAAELVADGGLEVGGDGSKPLTVEPEIGGGLEAGGDGSTPLSVERHADGGLQVGGADPVATFGIQTACCPHPIPNVMWANFDATSCPFGPPHDVPLIYDAVSGKWRGGLILGGACGLLVIEWHCDGVLAGGMFLNVTIPAVGFGTSGFPAGAEANCEAARWVYQIPGDAVACGCDPTAAFRVVVTKVRQPPP